jgi:hypothetical protein
LMAGRNGRFCLGRGEAAAVGMSRPDRDHLAYLFSSVEGSRGKSDHVAGFRTTDLVKVTKTQAGLPGQRTAAHEYVIAREL